VRQKRNSRRWSPTIKRSISGRADCSGNITNRPTYDEWGIPGSGNVARFQYTGQMWMPEIGMLL
jgi:hypothetical protein